MQPKTIGIVGGAGPLAGAFLLDRLFSLAGSLYGCNRDADFPKVILVSFPFSDMLSEEVDASQIREELRAVLEQLRANGATLLAIACNTLHAFLDLADYPDLIPLPQVFQELPIDPPLVLCTTTSARHRVHKQFFPCLYPEPRIQKTLDGIIDDILKGKECQAILQKLQELLSSQNASTIVLGCTELSIFNKDLSLINKSVIDPLEILAKKILEKSFLTMRQLCL